MQSESRNISVDKWFCEKSLRFICIIVIWKKKLFIIILFFVRQTRSLDKRSCKSKPCRHQTCKIKNWNN